ncbi:tautomerase family protein [Halomonas organivorans]|uniref:Phenylpyruvate tautomerase PptA (4-oxalocrotonate tautomerase family) n=1 Tax=Halomonas organivorans TaxID=257772 RepID=A0A7W5G5A2_9GAMM|nr:tautomerase family protein [Halomonas organivorans]MBB3141273.1 phenylpyruvate tautomerase PptA (4-oxalocrotonate tautomerase family) [Halomonas organivorans]
MIVIYGIRHRLDPIKARLSAVIHECMMSVLGMPEDKRAHRFMPMDAEDFYFPGGRSDAYTVIEINMMAGRAAETQRALIKALFARIEARLGIAPVDVEIILKEQPPHCWGFRGMTGDEARDLTYRVNV